MAEFEIFAVVGLISLQGFVKDDIICDYHGEESRMPFCEYVRQPDIDATYCVEVKGPNRRIIDAGSKRGSTECPIHPRQRCLGRLANHAGLVTRTGQRRRIHECNMKLVDINFNRRMLPAAPPCIAVFIATRAIKPLEELRFDYADRTAQEQFSM
jgi:hypothetical protein